MQYFVIVWKSFLVYLANAVVGIELSALLDTGVPYLEESLRVLELLYLANRGFLREQNAIAAEQNLVV